jgi:hypothetical protein
MKKTIYKTVIRAEILSETPIPDEQTLFSILEETNPGGNYSGLIGFEKFNTKLVGKMLLMNVTDMVLILKLFKLMKMAMLLII